MNRLARLKFICTPAGMRHAARVQQLRRGRLNEHRYVVGSFALVEGRVQLWCVEMGAAYEVPRPPRLTCEAKRYCRWRTRQAAHQFARRWQLADCHVVDLHWLDVLPGGQLDRVQTHQVDAVHVDRV